MRSLVLIAAALGIAACDAFPARPPCTDDASCGAGYRCNAERACEAAQGEVGERTAVLTAPVAPKADFLFVIDNSGSMCEEQDALAHGFASFARALVPPENPLDLRLAVVSTDLYHETDRGRFLARPAPAEPALNCEGAVPDTDGCQALVDSGELTPILATTGPDANISGAEDFAFKFRCLSTIGTNGDGFEKGLEALRLALSCDGPNKAAFGDCCTEAGYDPKCTAQPAFLRPDAVLVVAILSDEDDCSEPPGGPSVDRGNNNNCEWNRDELAPIEDYVKFLRGLKADPAGQLLVATMVGERAFTSDGYELSYNPPGEGYDTRCDRNHPDYDAELSRDECCPRGRCQGTTDFSCVSTFGAAMAGKRYLQFAEAFGQAGLGCPRDSAEGDCISLCRDPVSVAGAHFQKRLVESFPTLATFCLEERPACRVNGARCTSTAERADPAHYTWSARVKCDVGCEEDFGPSLDPDTLLCPSGVAVRFARHVPPGAQVLVRYAPDVDPTVQVTVPDVLPVPIPDDGVANSPLRQVKAGHVRQAALHVTIRHGERSDLKLILSHGGKQQLLYEGAERGEDLERVFEADDFIGDDATGEWTLQVADQWPLDEGVLERWALELKIEP